MSGHQQREGLQSYLQLFTVDRESLSQIASCYRGLAGRASQGWKAVNPRETAVPRLYGACTVHPQSRLEFIPLASPDSPTFSPPFDSCASVCPPRATLILHGRVACFHFPSLVSCFLHATEAPRQQGYLTNRSSSPTHLQPHYHACHTEGLRWSGPASARR